jgi:two-component system, OmpR family, response regulator
MTSSVRRVVLLEDDERLGAAVGAALEGAGVAVIRCTDATALVAAAELLAPDALLVEVLLPGGAAQLAVEAVRRHTHLRALPVIFITARVAAYDSARLTALAALGAAVDLAALLDPTTSTATTTSLCEQLDAARARQVGECPPSAGRLLGSS